jgi:hypothetical protein
VMEQWAATDACDGFRRGLAYTQSIAWLTQAE